MSAVWKEFDICEGTLKEVEKNDDADRCGDFILSWCFLFSGH